MELLKTFLGGAGGAALVAGLFGLWQWWLTRRAKEKDAVSEKENVDCIARGQELQKLHEEVEVLKTAMRAQFYNDIKRRAKEYISRKYITVEEYEDLCRDYSIYHDKDKLDGNGVLKGIMEEIEHLEKRVI